MRNFTKMKSWLMVMVMGLMISASSAFAGEDALFGSITANNAYISGATTDVSFNLTYTSPDTEWADDVTLTFPAGFTINSAGTINGKVAVITGQNVFWDVQYVSSNVNVDFTVNVTVDGSTLGNQDIDYVVNGDGWAAAPHVFSGTAVLTQAIPKLGINPLVLDLGEWPIGAWQEMAYLELFNEGTGSVSVINSELDDLDGVFALTNPNLPLTLVEAGPSTMVGVSFVGDGVADGVYNATYVASWGAAKSVTTADIMVTAYTAAVGDVVENPYMATLPVAEIGESTGMPMRGNYVIPGSATNGKDVVYSFTLAEDQEVTFAITNATETPKMAVYASDFGGEMGPGVTNAVATGGADIMAAPLYAGTYYLVVSCEADDAAMTYDINIDGTTMPDPEKAFNPSPADGEMGVINPVVLTWEFGQYTNEYKLSYGTTYPPSEVLVPWTTNLETSYNLGNLDPSMQYFWRVDVRNNNGTVDGDDWGFTTTITPPSNLTATVVTVAQDEYDVQLSWTGSAKALLSYNIYRDGTFLATTLAGTTTYLDEDLAYNMNPCYEYTVEAIFDEGVSGMSNTASACITGVGTVNGTVTELLTGDPIDGAEVKLTSTTGGTNYIFTTDFMGFYTGEVLEDCYDYVVVADGYITDMGTVGECIDYNTTVTIDFQLDEFPYPVGDVIATELSNSVVQVDWSGTGGGNNVAEWLYYDDGVNTNAVAPTGGGSFSWAIRYTPDQLTELGGASVTKFQYYVNDATPVTFTVWQGENAATAIYTEEFTGLTAAEWVELTLATPVAIDITQELWIGFSATVPASVFPASFGAYLNEPKGQMITLDGVQWDFLGDLAASLSGEWNLRAFVTDAAGKSLNLSKVTYADYKSTGQTFVAASTVANNSALPTTINKGEKDLLGYNVYRQDCDGINAMEFLGYTLDEMFTDNNWGDVEWGTYKWAVEAVYTNNASEPAYSNCLDKDMEATVMVEVTLNSADIPEGVDVTFTNTSEPDLMLIYENTTDATGMFTIEPFRKGTYNIDVVLAGYTEIHEVGVLIDQDMTFTWMLDELLLPPSDLYVTPTGYATWRGSGSLPFEPLMENFDTQEAFDMWEVIVGGSSADTWHWTTDDGGNTLDGTPMAFADSDAAGSGSTMDEILISPVVDASMVDELILEWDQNYQNFAGLDVFTVDVFDGTDWVEVFMQDYDDSSWPSTVHNMVDVSAYANADFRVRFHWDCPGWYWQIALDNVHVHDNSGKYNDKAFQFYKVFHNDVFSTDRDTTFYQYGENEVLVAGETYHACVSSLYSTGLSEESCYDWTYLPCDSFPGFNTIDAFNVDPSDDVLVVWSDMVPLELVTITQNPGAPSNGYYQAFGMGYGVAYDFTAYPDALVNAVDFHHASWGVTGTWDYDIHIYNWDTKTLIQTVGPIQTTGNDIWEMGVELGDISTGGAATVAILMEPKGNIATDAYPDMSSDDAADPQGSIYGDLADPNAIGASTIGNFLMNVTIYTANSGGKSAPVVINSIEAPTAKPRVATNNTFSPTQIITQTASKSNKAAAIAIGANIYRDGEMIAYVPSPDTFYLDQDLMPGYYDYCVTTVYTEDDGLHTWNSCMDNCIEDVLVPEDCIAPTDLTAEDLLGDGYTATLNWTLGGGSSVAEWLSYDDGVNVNAVAPTGGGTFSWAIRYTPDQLTELDGASITKFQYYVNDATPVTFTVWQGANAATSVYTEEFTGLAAGEWVELTLATPAPIDVAQELWIGFTATVPASVFPASFGAYLNEPKGQMITLDGVQWDFLGDLAASLSGEWNLKAYVTDANGKSLNINDVQQVNYETLANNNFVAASTEANDSPSNTLNIKGATVLEGTNVYRDGEMIAFVAAPETTYADVVGEAGYVCYEVKAVYSVCGESDPSNEACVDVALGVNELENNISIYPNPAQDFVMVEANSNISTVIITNYMGQVVSSTKSVELTKTRIETSNLSAGVYFVEVETEAGIEKVRIVISK